MKNTGIAYFALEPDIKKAVGLVALTREKGLKCPYENLDIYISWEIFEASVPVMWLISVDGIPMCHTEIRDLGSVNGYRIAGLSATTVAEGFRHRGIYKCTITLKNILLDRSDFACTVSRLKKGHEDHHMAQYPGYEVFLPKGPWGAVWCIRVIKPFTNARARVREYLLKNKVRW